MCLGVMETRANSRDLIWTSSLLLLGSKWRVAVKKLSPKEAMFEKILRESILQQTYNVWCLKEVFFEMF
jgi:hypothetical protein